MPELSQTCPACLKELPVAGAAFCPFCGASVLPVAAPPHEAAELLNAAAKTGDPVRRHALLIEAREKCPGCLAVERELLHLGRLHERNLRRPSYDVIKCYLLHMYLTPGEFTPEQKSAMRRELFEDEQLARCQTLAPDGEAFTREYLLRLSDEFISLFMESSSRYMRSVFGFSLNKNTAKLLAAPAADTLLNMHRDEALDFKRRAMLVNAFYQAFAKRVGGATEYLQAELDGAELSLPLA